MHEVDSFLQENAQYKNRIKESHPEVCFARLNGSALQTKKSDEDGVEERIHILSYHMSTLNKNEIMLNVKKFRCNVDDIIDAICLVVTANLVVQRQYEVIPMESMIDDTGILIQMSIPKK